MIINEKNYTNEMKRDVHRALGNLSNQYGDLLYEYIADEKLKNKTLQSKLKQQNSSNYNTMNKYMDKQNQETDNFYKKLSSEFSASFQKKIRKQYDMDLSKLDNEKINKLKREREEDLAIKREEVMKQQRYKSSAKGRLDSSIVEGAGSVAKGTAGAGKFAGVELLRGLLGSSPIGQMALLGGDLLNRSGLPRVVGGAVSNIAGKAGTAIKSIPDSLKEAKEDMETKAYERKIQNAVREAKGEANKLKKEQTQISPQTDILPVAEGISKGTPEVIKSIGDMSITSMTVGTLTANEFKTGEMTPVKENNNINDIQKSNEEFVNIMESVFNPEEMKNIFGDYKEAFNTNMEKKAESRVDEYNKAQKTEQGKEVVGTSAKKVDKGTPDEDDTVVKATQGIGQTVSEAVGGIASTVSNAFKGVVKVVGGIANTVGKIVGNVLSTIFKVISGIGKAISVVTSFIGGIGAVIGQVVGSVFKVVGGIGTFIGNAFKGVVKAVGVIASTIGKVIGTAFKVLGGIVGGMAKVIVGAAGFLLNPTTLLIGAIIGGLILFLPMLKTMFATSTIGKALTTLSETLAPIFQDIQTLVAKIDFSKLWDGIKVFTKDAFNLVEKVVTGAINGIDKTIKNFKFDPVFMVSELVRGMGVFLRDGLLDVGATIGALLSDFFVGGKAGAEVLATRDMEQRDQQLIDVGNEIASFTETLTRLDANKKIDLKTAADLAATNKELLKAAKTKLENDKAYQASSADTQKELSASFDKQITQVDLDLETTKSAIETEYKKDTSYAKTRKSELETDKITIENEKVLFTKIKAVAEKNNFSTAEYGKLKEIIKSKGTDLTQQEKDAIGILAGKKIIDKAKQEAMKVENDTKRQQILDKLNILKDKGLEDVTQGIKDISLAFKDDLKNLSDEAWKFFTTSQFPKKDTPKKAQGGYVQKGKSYIVGDGGTGGLRGDNTSTEMFVPQTDGKIVPNYQLKDSANLVNKLGQTKEVKQDVTLQDAVKNLTNIITKEKITNSTKETVKENNQKANKVTYEPTSEILRYVLVTGGI